MTEVVDPKKRGVAELSVDAQVVTKLLAKAQPGEIVTYQAMGQAVGLKDIRQHPSIMYTARRSVRRDNRIVFSAIDNEGLKRINDDENVDQSREVMVRRIRSTCREASKNLACVDYPALSNEKKVQFNLAASLAGGIHQALNPKRIDQVENRVKEAQDKLPTEKLIAAFLSNGNGK